MGPHEKAALERERRDLQLKVNKSQMEGRRLDEIEKLLGHSNPAPDPFGGSPTLDRHGNLTGV